MKRAFEAKAQIATRHATSMWLVMLTALVLGLGALAAQAPAAGAQESDGDPSGVGQAEPSQSEDNGDSAPSDEPAPRVTPRTHSRTAASPREPR